MNDSFEPEITVLYCGRGLANGAYLSEGTQKSNGFKVRFIMLACSSKVEVDYLVKLIEEGADGVLLAACPQERCQFMLGSVRAGNRVKYAGRLLDEVGMGADRLGIAQAQDISADELLAFAGERAAVIKELGQNPMKSRG